MTEWLHFHFSLSCIGEGNGNPLQCSCLENPGVGGAWWASVYGVAQSWTWLKWLSNHLPKKWTFSIIILGYQESLFALRKQSPCHCELSDFSFSKSVMEFELCLTTEMSVGCLLIQLKPSSKQIQTILKRNYPISNCLLNFCTWLSHRHLKV